MNKDEFFNWCATKRKLGKNSMRHTRIRYDVLMRWLEGNELTPSKAQAFILSFIESGKANATVNSYIRIISLIDVYERDHSGDLNLMKEIAYLDKTRRTPTIFTENEVDSILGTRVLYANRAVKGSQINETYHLVTYVIFATGCRLNEALGLLVDDITVGEEGYINIRNNKYRMIKNKLERQVPIPNYPLLREHIKNKKPGDLAFTTATGNVIPPQCMESDWAKRKTAAGIVKRGRLHDARNTYIMEHIRKKTHLLNITVLVGHKDPKSTLWYTSFNQEELQRAASNHHLYKNQLTPKQKLNKEYEKLQEIRNAAEVDSDFEPPVLIRTENKIILEISINKKYIDQKPTTIALIP